MDELSDLDFFPPDNTPLSTAPSLLTEPAKTVAPINPSDPARLGYPPTFPIEVALRTSPIRAVCESYNITEDEWDLIRQDPVFISDLKRAADMLKEEGMSFRLKAKLQSEELLKTSWRMIHNPNTPPSVAADLIKSTARWAHYDVPPSQQPQQPGSGFSISINFTGEKPEPRVINGG